MKHLLLTNDDGIHAEGLQLLLEALKGQYKITIVAPDSEKSASGVSITSNSPIQVKSVHLGKDVKAYSVAGTPADCIKLAINGGLSERPDLIISGINPGSNAGRNLFYSGTVGAVIEASFKGLSGVAFSVQWQRPATPHLPSTLPLIKEIVAHLLADPLPKGTLLNVNFPCQPPYNGLKWTKQGVGVWQESPYTNCDLASGSALFHLGMAHHLPEEEESDTHWLERGFVTLVPLQTELTNHKILEERGQMIFDLSKN